MSKKAGAPKVAGEKIYEIGYHIISSIAEENIPAEVAKVKDYLAKEGAVIIAEETPALRPLAYSIKKAFGGTYKTFDKAYFGFIKFELPEGGDITKIDEKLKANENILRHIVVKTVRENTMYSPKITVFSDKEAKIKLPAKAEKIEKVAEASASAEEIDAGIDALISKEEI
jgi:ribosomal protein S6